MDPPPAPAHKGKERAADDADAPPPPPPETPNANGARPSLGSRIVASAAALARDAAAPPGLASGLASLTSGKAGGSAEQQQHPAAGPSSSSSSSGGLRPGLEAGSFRERIGGGATGEQVDAFLGADPEISHPFLDDPVLNGRQQHPWATEFAGNGAAASESGVSANRQQREPLDDEPHEELRDGEAVRQLLSDPNFVAMADVYDVDEPLPASDLFPANFSAEEQDAVEKIRADLPSAPVHRGVPLESAMNLLPNVDLLELDPIDEDNLQPAARRKRLLDEWSSVLGSYTDDVWGDLLPTIREVREDIEEARRGAVLNDKALARLRMVLNHMRGLPVG
jgi:hypothetical protein